MPGLLISIGPGFAVLLEGFPGPFQDRVRQALDHCPAHAGAPTERPVVVRVEESGRSPAGEVVIEEPPLVVRRDGESIHFELPAIRVACEASRGLAGVCLRSPSAADFDRFVGLVLAPLLVELGVSRGWLGIHGASVFVGGVGMLLPGPSGAGKSTIFAGVHRAGHDVLSDDLTWLRPVADGWRMHAFPRPERALARPTVDDVPLQAIVCPAIVDGTDNRLSPLTRPELVGALLAQSGFLSAGSVAEERFRACVRICRAIPGYRLEAGRRTAEVPRMLERLADSLSHQESR